MLTPDSNHCVRVSRKVAIQWATILWVIGTIVQSTSNGVSMLITGRLISGLCIQLSSHFIVADYDEALQNAVKFALFINHLLCLWHITKNVQLHAKQIFRAEALIARPPLSRKKVTEHVGEQ
ncbi:hypothetical protein V1515DRAFT_588527 [Lipomyces mesembrius]